MRSLIIVNAWYLRCERFWIQFIERLYWISLNKLGQLKFINNDNPFLHISLFPLYDLLLFCLLATAHTFRASGTTNIGASSGSCAAHLTSARCRSCRGRTDNDLFVVLDSVIVALGCHCVVRESRMSVTHSLFRFGSEVTG